MNDMFITFGEGQKINNFDLMGYFMKIDESDIPKVIEQSKSGFYVFCGRYPMSDLKRQQEQYGITEITQDEYIRLKNEN